MCWTVLAQAGDSGGLLPFPVLLALIVGMFYLMIIRPEKNKQKIRRELIDGLKKNDRVVTVGGIYGVVTNVQREADEVTVKVDETNNTKLRVTFGAIDRVVVENAEGEKSGKK